MTVKEVLKQRIDDLTDEQAAERLARMEWESSKAETLTDEDLDRLAAAELECSAGDVIDGRELFQRLGVCPTG